MTTFPDTMMLNSSQAGGRVEGGDANQQASGTSKEGESLKIIAEPLSPFLTVRPSF